MINIRIQFIYEVENPIISDATSYLSRPSTSKNRRELLTQ